MRPKQTTCYRWRKLSQKGAGLKDTQRLHGRAGPRSTGPTPPGSPDTVPRRHHEPSRTSPIKIKTSGLLTLASLHPTPSRCLHLCLAVRSAELPPITQDTLLPVALTRPLPSTLSSSLRPSLAFREASLARSTRASPVQHHPELYAHTHIWVRGRLCLSAPTPTPVSNPGSLPRPQPCRQPQHRPGHVVLNTSVQNTAEWTRTLILCTCSYAQEQGSL